MINLKICFMSIFKSYFNFPLFIYFCIQVLALTKDKRYFERVSERIIRQLMRQSDEGIEYEASDDEDADEDSETGYESDLAEKENDEDEVQMEEEEDEPDEDEE